MEKNAVPFIVSFSKAEKSASKAGGLRGGKDKDAGEPNGDKRLGEKGK